MATDVETLSGGQIEDAETQASIIASSAQQVVQAGQFVFFAAFDGTNDDRTNVPLSDSPLPTNVAVLETMVADANIPNLSSHYIAGVGTGDSSALTNSTWAEQSVTEQVVAKAEEMYEAFSVAARTWLQDPDHAGGSVTTMITAFSRGCASAAIFSQLLYEKGLSAANGDVLIAPGKIGVSAGVLFDPVSTGINGNLAFAPNVTNVVDITAAHEYRYAFEATDYSAQEGAITSLSFVGDHTDIGGGYDQGLGALTLEAATGFFQGTGLNVSTDDIPADHQFDTGQDVIRHSEGTFPNGAVKWSEYDDSDGRLYATNVTVAPAVEQPDGDGGALTTMTDALGHHLSYTQVTLDGVLTETMDVRDGTTDNVLRETKVETSADKVVTTVSVDNEGDGTIDSVHQVTKTLDGKWDSLQLHDGTTDDHIVSNSVTATFSDTSDVTVTTDTDSQDNAGSGGGASDVVIHNVDGSYRAVTDDGGGWVFVEDHAADDSLTGTLEMDFARLDIYTSTDGVSTNLELGGVGYRFDRVFADGSEHYDDSSSMSDALSDGSSYALVVEGPSGVDNIQNRDSLGDIRNMGATANSFWYSEILANGEYQGVSAIDGHLHIVAYDSAGHTINSSNESVDLSSFSYSFTSLSGAQVSFSVNAEGSWSTAFDDGELSASASTSHDAEGNVINHIQTLGNERTTTYSDSGSLLSSETVRQDGSLGQVERNADGSYENTIVDSDGTKYVSTTAADGSKDAQIFDGLGNLTFSGHAPNSEWSGSGEWYAEKVVGTSGDYFSATHTGFDSLATSIGTLAGAEAHWDYTIA